MFDLMIIGGGPAALSAAFYASEKQLNVVMVYEDLGGKVGWRESLVGTEAEQQRFIQPRQPSMRPDHQALDDEHYLPANVLVRLLTRRVTQTCRLIHDRALTVSKRLASFAVETREQGQLQAAAVLVATGATPVLLDVPGAQRLIGRGLGYSITTYAHLVAGKQVAVIGTTARALLGAAELARTAERVYLVAPRPGHPSAGSGQALTTPLAAALRFLPNVEVLKDYAVTEVIGATTIEELVLQGEGQTRRLRLHHAFVDLGLTPHSDIVQGLVHTDPDGFIIVDQQNATTTPGLFAAGDVTTNGCEQVLIAVGDGARAARSAYRYLLAWSLASHHSPAA